MSQLTLRAVAGNDADQIAAIYAPYVRDTAISFELVPPTAAQMGERIGAITAIYPWLVCADGDELLGYAYGSRFRERPAYQWSMEVSVYVRRDAHRRGIGRALYGALLPLCTAQGFCNAYAVITLAGPASVRFHESLGFRPIGVYSRVGFKLGAWHDVGSWVLPLRPHPETPEAPRAVATLRDAPEWNAALARGQAILQPAA